MMLNIPFLVALMLLMTAGCVISITARSLTSSVVSMGTAGLILSILFLLLGAPDLAIVQIFVEIVTLIVLLSTIRRETTADMSSSGLYGIITLVVFALFLFVFVLHYQEIVRPFGEPVMTMGAKYLAASAPLLKAPNAVTSIVLDFRGYDTLGEATVIFVAITGVVVLLRVKGRKDGK
jgi:multisubunit Na+/H+ antiporter MnhB subunit